MCNILICNKTIWYRTGIEGRDDSGFDPTLGGMEWDYEE